MITRDPTIEYKTIILAGLGREGLSSYRYFSKLYPQVVWIFSDDKDASSLDQDWQQLLAQPNVRFSPLDELGLLTDQLEVTSTLLVKTAGIAVEKSGIQACLSAGVALTSNTAAFFAALATLPIIPLVIGVTGTKGKSTTASMIYHVLKENGVRALLSGNIGTPPLEALQDSVITDATAQECCAIVLELSSHQLRELTVSPPVAVIQDITPEHQDYYTDFEQYLEAKSAICRFQTNLDWVIYNPTYSNPDTLASRSQGKKLTFSLEKPPGALDVAARSSQEPKVYAHDGWLWFADQRVISINDVPLLGKHNLLNTMPAIAIGMELFGLAPTAIASAIKSFVGLPHRLEFAGEVNGVRYYNDSQATTPEATMAALKSYPDKAIVLLAGGSDKGVSFAQLGEVILHSNILKLIMFPPMGEKIVAAVQAAADRSPGSVVPPVQTAHSMPEAILEAAAAATPGSVVLLSPACASFGLFKNYQDRGDQFKSGVAALATH